jgi:hypothetical protein
MNIWSHQNRFDGIETSMMKFFLLDFAKKLHEVTAV